VSPVVMPIGYGVPSGHNSGNAICYTWTATDTPTNVQTHTHAYSFSQSTILTCTENADILNHKGVALLMSFGFSQCGCLLEMWVVWR